MPRAGFVRIHELLTGEPILSLYEIAEEERQRLIAKRKSTKDTRTKHLLDEQIAGLTRASLGGAR